MKILDGHIHLDSAQFSRQGLLERFAQAGVDGGVIFSQPPTEAVMSYSAPFDDRLRRVLALTEGSGGALVPALWIHPHEPDACERAKVAARQGIMAFKMICDSYYPYEDDCLTLVRTIAALGKPIIFHSGILWDGGVTSQYNRPLHFEALIQVPKLRFSLAHCAWPWHDECIALYGKFLNTMAQNRACSAEMFFDLTPGTPKFYRRDLLQKLFGVGYDVRHNILFGSDCNVADYNVDWVKSWRAIDDGLYDELDVPADTRQCIYADNLLRFLGLGEATVSHAYPLTGLL